MKRNKKIHIIRAGKFAIKHKYGKMETKTHVVEVVIKRRVK